MMMVKTDGTVIPAHSRCYNYPLGRVQDTPLAQLWNNARYTAFRRLLHEAGGTLPGLHPLLRRGRQTGPARCCRRRMIKARAPQHPEPSSPLSAPATPAFPTSVTGLTARYTTALLLGGIVLLGLGIRLYGLTAYGIWFDEAYHIALVQQPTAGAMLDAVLSNPPSDPLYVLLLRPWVGLFGASDGAVRLLSVGCQHGDPPGNLCAGAGAGRALGAGCWGRGCWRSRPMRWNWGRKRRSTPWPR